MLCCSTVAWTQTATQRLVVWQKSGEKIYIDMTDEPRTTFENGLLVITSNSPRSNYQFQLSNILRYTFEGGSTDIGTIVSRDLTVAQNDEGVTLKNVPNGTIVRMFDSSGRLLDSRKSDGAPILFSLQSRPAGVYLVNLNDKTFKISKR